MEIRIGVDCAKVGGVIVVVVGDSEWIVRRLEKLLLLLLEIRIGVDSGKVGVVVVVVGDSDRS